MTDARVLLERLVGDLEHAKSLNVTSVAVEEVLPNVREALDLYARERFMRDLAEATQRKGVIEGKHK